MQDIPFSDCFRVETKSVVQSIGATSCRVSISLGVFFMKSTWFKGKIESGATSESKESHKLMMNLMKNEINKSTANSSSSQSGGSANTIPVVAEDDRRPMGDVTMSPEPSTAAIASEIDFLEKMFTAQFGLLSLVLVVMLFFIAKFSGATPAISSESHLYTWIALGIVFLFLLKMERKTHKMISDVRKDISDIKKIVQQQNQQSTKQ